MNRDRDRDGDFRDMNFVNDYKNDEIFCNEYYKDYEYYKDFVEEKQYKERMRREMIEDLIDGFCSSDDTIRIDNMVIRWKISRRNAAELIANFELQQSIIDSTWV